MHRWLHMRLCAPLMAFGGVAIDHVGPTRTLPAASALTGLFANALGWHWRETGHHQALQDRLVFGALLARPGRPLADSQNARVYEEEPGWTTRGEPEKRNKGKTYSNKPLTTQIGNQRGRKWSLHRRQRDYLADAAMHVALRLEPSDQAPTLDDLAHALDRPARPLFIGRKACLPAAPLRAGWIEAATALDALRSLASEIEPGGGAVILSAGEGEPANARHEDLADIRNWRTGLHAGARPVVRGTL